MVGLGGNTFGTSVPYGKGVDAAGTAAIVRRALELGINFIDTAEGYSKGLSEEFIGKAIAGQRAHVVIATKTGGGSLPGARLTRHGIISRAEASLRRLQTDYIDVLYFHVPDPLTPIEESLRAIEQLVRSGKVLHPAVSNFPAWALAEMCAIADRRGYSPVAAAQSKYNLLDRSVEGELLPACAHFGVSFIPFYPLAGGFLTGKYRKDVPPPEGSRHSMHERMSGVSYLTASNFAALDRYESFAKQHGRSMTELSIAWLLSHPAVASVIAGATSVDQLDAHGRAGDWELSAADVSEIA